MADEGSSCYAGVDIFKAVLITFVVVVLLEIAAYIFYKKYWKNRKGPRLVADDKEAQKDEYAFDNPGFHGEPVKEAKNKSLLETKWLPIGTLLKQDKRRTVDDSSPVDFPVRAVPLKGRDFTGLGFDIRGGLRDGIYVDSLRQSGPAHQSGQIQPGDKLRSIRIDLEHVALQDALNILGSAAPYDVLLEVQQQHPQFPAQAGESPGNTRAGRSSGGRPEHPLYRAYSSGDVTKVNTLKKNTADSGFDELSPVKLDKASNNKLTPKSSNSSSTMERERERNGSAVYAIENEKKQTHVVQNKEIHNGKPEVSKRHNVEDDKTQKDHENDAKKGLKFGIRVLPPNVNDKLFGKTAKIETATKEVVPQTNGEDQAPRPAPVVKRRNKVAAEPQPLNNNETVDKVQTSAFVRQGSANSSGIKRDSAGIPQELPEHMLQAAMAARTNRKSSGDALKDSSEDIKTEHRESEMNLKDLKEQFLKSNFRSNVNVEFDTHDKPTFEFVSVKNRNGKDTDGLLKSSDDENTIKSTKKSKGKAPLPPEMKKPEVKHVLEFKNINNTDTDMDVSTETMNTNLSVDVTDNVTEEDSTLNQVLDLDLIENVPDKLPNDLLNRCDDSIILTDRPSKSSTPKSLKKSFDCEEILKPDVAPEENTKPKEELSDSDMEIQNISSSGTTIELNSSHITIHHISPTEGMDSETRKTASLGDLSRLNNNAQKLSTANGTLERAQSLDISDQNEQAVTPKKRKAQNGPQDFYQSLNMNSLEEHNTSSKEPKLMTNLNLQLTSLDGPNNFNRLKKSTEWGNLEDAISQISTPSSTPSDIDVVNQKSETTYITKTPDVSKFNFRFSDTPAFKLNTNESNNGVPDVDKIEMYETNISDDIKVSRHSFNSLERPRSEMLTMVSNFNTDPQSNQIDEVKFSQPVSLTFVQDDPAYEINVHTVSPTFTSDVKGVNNINISMKDNEKMEDNENQNNENIMTIVTTDSQPSSIICIESESNSLNKISLNDISDTFSVMSNPEIVKMEKRVNESNGSTELSSKLMTLTPFASNNDSSTNFNHKTYITEIEVLTPYNKENDMKTMEKLVEVTNHAPKSAIYEFKSINSSDADLDIYQLNSTELTDDTVNTTKPKFEYAKNAEIKFSTSTYEQPKSEKRLSQIEFLRSNFEKNAELFKSNIPKPTSPPKSNLSPSKIPVFNSTKVTEVSKTPAKQSVSITAIKSSSRNPSGK